MTAGAARQAGTRANVALPAGERQRKLRAHGLQKSELEEPMVVDEIMTNQLITAKPSTSIRRVMELLAEAEVRHIPITENGELVGIVSDRDLRAFQVPPLSLIEKPGELAAMIGKPISTVMSSNVVTVQPETEIEEAIDLMLDQKVGAIPVVREDTGELAGILSYMDVLKAARNALAE
jgi:acetoin utilization protein AcuB